MLRHPASLCFWRRVVAVCVLELAMVLPGCHPEAASPPPRDESPLQTDQLVYVLQPVNSGYQARVVVTYTNRYAHRARRLAWRAPAPHQVITVVSSPSRSARAASFCAACDVVC